MKEWSLYIIEAENGKLYTGITKNLKRRLEQHKSLKGAKFFRTTAPKVVRYLKKNLLHSYALKLEYQVKKLSKVDKLLFIKGELKIRIKK
jgi:putative endonuclease